jgi:hypothetical protein
MQEAKGGINNQSLITRFGIKASCDRVIIFRGVYWEVGREEWRE